MKSTVAIFSIALLALQCPAGAQAPSGKTTGGKTVLPAPANGMDSFFGFPFKAAPLSAIEFEEFIPAPYLKLRLNMPMEDAGKILPPKFGPKGQELRYGEKFYFSHEQIQYHNLPGTGVQGHSILTDIVFDTYHNPPPTRDRIRKLAGLLYRALGHPSGIYESPERRGLSLVWVKGPAHVSLDTDFFQNGPPRTILRVLNLKVRDYPFEFPTSKDWVEVKIQNNAAAFRTKFDKWLSIFLTTEEEKASLAAYQDLKARLEKDANPASPPNTKPGVGEASATVQVDLKKKPAPKYTTLIGEELSGSAFHFVHDGNRRIACSLHQFDGKTPQVLGSMDFEETIQITSRAYQNDDIQVLEYRSKELDALTPLAFDPAFVPSVGETVYLYEFDEVYEGVIAKNEQSQRSFIVKMAQPYPAGGNSGSPVVSAKNGKVVGVMLKADHPKEAKVVVFELLAPKKTP